MTRSSGRRLRMIHNDDMLRSTHCDSISVLCNTSREKVDNCYLNTDIIRIVLIKKHQYCTENQDLPGSNSQRLL